MGRARFWNSNGPPWRRRSVDLHVELTAARRGARTPGSYYNLRAAACTAVDLADAAKFHFTTTTSTTAARPTSCCRAAGAPSSGPARTSCDRATSGRQLRRRGWGAIGVVHSVASGFEGGSSAGTGREPAGSGAVFDGDSGRRRDIGSGRRRQTPNDSPATSRSFRRSSRTRIPLPLASAAGLRWAKDIADAQAQPHPHAGLQWRPILTPARDARPGRRGVHPRARGASCLAGRTRGARSIRAHGASGMHSFAQPSRRPLDRVRTGAAATRVPGWSRR
jgi:hypothetical protein